MPPSRTPYTTFRMSPSFSRGFFHAFNIDAVAIERKADASSEAKVFMTSRLEDTIAMLEPDFNPATAERTYEELRDLAKDSGVVLPAWHTVAADILQ